MYPLWRFGGNVIQSSGRDEQNWKLLFPQSDRVGTVATAKDRPGRQNKCDCALFLRPSFPCHPQLNHPKKELLVLGKQSLADIKPGKLKLNSLHEMKFGLRNVPAAGVNTGSKRINSEAAGGKKRTGWGERETRAPFYPFKLADLDDKGSCLIPLCASEYTKTNNPKESTRLAKKLARRCGVPSNLAESKSKRKRKEANRIWQAKLGYPSVSVQTIATPSGHQRVGGCFPEAPGCKSASAPWSFPGASSKQGSNGPTSGKD